jgi:hypothetical protein
MLGYGIGFMLGGSLVLGCIYLFNLSISPIPAAALFLIGLGMLIGIARKEE